MNANELRIGNYIISGNNGKYSENGIVGKVLEIGNVEREFEQIYCECDESFEWFFKDNYFGITLTEEWLDEFGLNRTTFYGFEHSYLWYHIEKQEEWYYIGISQFDDGNTVYFAWNIYCRCDIYPCQTYCSRG